VYGRIYSYDRIASISPDYDHNRKNKQNKKNPEKKFADVLKEKTGEEKASPEQKTNIDVRY
jgi:hypothetical protein